MPGTASRTNRPCAEATRQPMPKSISWRRRRTHADGGGRQPRWRTQVRGQACRDCRRALPSRANSRRPRSCRTGCSRRASESAARSTRRHSPPLNVKIKRVQSFRYKRLHGAYSWPPAAQRSQSPALARSSPVANEWKRKPFICIMPPIIVSENPSQATRPRHHVANPVPSKN